MNKPVQNKGMLLSALVANRHMIRSYGVLKLGIFGSFVTGKLKQDSDIDFLVEFAPLQKNFDNYMDLSFYLEDLLGRRVELVTPQGLSKYIGPHILKQVEHVAI